MRIEEMISAVQRALGVAPDGRAGPQTWNAIYQQVARPSATGRKLSIEKMIAAVQRAVGVQADGKAGPQTWDAIRRHVTRTAAKSAKPAKAAKTAAKPGKAAPLPPISPVDARSEKVIATLLPEVRSYARALVQKAAQSGIVIKIISGLRTYAEQDALYAKGRTAPGHIVTKAKGGYSNHNFGIAFDVGVFEGGKYKPESPKYKAVGVLGEDIGLEWGGSWKTIHDEPHFQLRPEWAAKMSEKAMLAELRARVANGMPIYP